VRISFLLSSESWWTFPSFSVVNCDLIPLIFHFLQHRVYPKERTRKYFPLPTALDLLDDNFEPTTVSAFPCKSLKIGPVIFEIIMANVHITTADERKLASAWASMRTAPCSFALDEKNWGTRTYENPSVSKVDSKEDKVGIWIFEV